MHLSLGVGGILPREVLPGGIGIGGGERFPSGTDIGVLCYAIHHNHVYFPNPFVFKPERWLLRGKFEGGVSADTKKRRYSSPSCCSCMICEFSQWRLLVRVHPKRVMGGPSRSFSYAIDLLRRMMGLWFNSDQGKSAWLL